MSNRKVRTNDIIQILATWSGTAMMVALVLVGMLFWHPGYRAWGVAACGLILAMLIWMLRGLHERTSIIPGNPIHWVWLGLTVYLSVIQFFAQYFPKIIAPSGLNGFINISMIMQLLLLSLGCLLFQEFMSRGQAARWLREISAFGIILLSLGLDSLFPLEIPRTSMWLIGCTGVMMAAANAFSAGASRTVGLGGFNMRHQIAIWVQLGVAGAGLLWLLYSGTVKSFVLFASIALTVFAFSWICRLWASKFSAFCILAGIVWWAIIMSGCLWYYYYNNNQPLTFWGLGEKGIRYFSGADDGITVLLNVVGLAGVGGMFAGLVAVSITAISKSTKPDTTEFLKTVLWLAACWMATAAWMAKKSFFCVTPLLIMMMAWGLLAVMADIQVKWHKAWRFALPMALGLFWLAIANESTLFQKAAFSFGYNDFSLHKIAGAVFCVFLVWCLARKKWWWAVPAVIIAVMAGGAGEVFQKLFSRRNEDMRDWQSHIKGAVYMAAMLAFILAGRAGLICQGGKIISASKNWKKYVRIVGMTGQVIVIGIGCYFWSSLVSNALPGSSYRDIDLLAPDFVVASNFKKYGNGFLLPAISTHKLHSGTAELCGYYHDPSRKATLFTSWTGSANMYGYSYLCFFAGNPGETINMLSLLGDPFGPCGYIKRNTMFQVVSTDSKLLLIDTDSLMKWAVEDESDFVKKLQSLSSQYNLIFVHPGPWKKYCKDLPLLREIFPDVPVVGHTALEWGFMTSVQKLCGQLMIAQNHPKTVCLTENPHYMTTFASGLGNYNCVRSVIVKPGYALPDSLRKGPQKHLFICKQNMSDVLKELSDGGIKRN